jgi:hypothetical protein
MLSGIALATSELTYKNIGLRCASERRIGAQTSFNLRSIISPKSKE